MPAGGIWDDISKDRLAIVARYAIDTPAFRTTARVVTDTQAAIQNDAGLAQELGPHGSLDHEEIAFCIGWVRLAEAQCTTDNQLVAALQDELDKTPPAG